jgi:hypothetical protein
MITKTKLSRGRSWALVYDNSFDTFDGQVEIDCQHLIEDMHPLSATLHCNCGEDHALDLRHCSVCEGFWLDVTDLGPMPERFHGDMHPIRRGRGQ